MAGSVARHPRLLLAVPGPRRQPRAVVLSPPLAASGPRGDRSDEPIWPGLVVATVRVRHLRALGPVCRCAEYGDGMDAAALREIQRPLKDKYRDDPDKAVVTLRAEGSLADSEVACSVQTGRALVEAGLHPATGGDGNLACSGDMLLQALVACAGVTLRSVATNRGIDVTGVVRAEGDLDFRGTLGVNRAAPVGFCSIRLMFDLDSNASTDELDALIAATERYCVVYQTLASSPELKVDRTMA